MTLTSWLSTANQGSLGFSAGSEQARRLKYQYPRATCFFRLESSSNIWLAAISHVDSMKSYTPNKSSKRRMRLLRLEGSLGESVQPCFPTSEVMLLWSPFPNLPLRKQKRNTPQLWPRSMRFRSWRRLVWRPTDKNDQCSALNFIN